MTDPVIYAAAYLLLTGAPVIDEGQPAPVPAPIADPIMCDLPSPPPRHPNMLQRVFDPRRDQDQRRGHHWRHRRHHHR